jgi:isopenicillin N synthase-like dioxygenase
MRIYGRVAEEIIQNGHSSVYTDFRIREAVARIFQAGDKFFRSSHEEKLQSSFPNGNGYRPQGIEYSQNDDHPDEMESFSITALNGTLVGSPQGRVLYERMCAAIGFFEAITEQVAAELARKAREGIDVSTMQGAFRNWSSLQLNYSRPASCTSELINDPHEDGHFVTLATANAPGLEIEAKDGGFVPVSRGDGALLVMPGDTARLLSGGLVRPLYHQVRRHPDVQERMALVYFADVDPTRCEPWIHNDVNANVDVGARIRANSSRFGLQAFSSD